MRVAGIQMEVVSGHLERNKEKGEKLVLQAIKKGAQLVVLPELWSTGYHLTKETFLNLQPQTVKIVEQFQTIAKAHSVVLVVPFIDKKEEGMYIALAVIESNGEIVQVYHKSFLWDKEPLYFVQGERELQPVQTSVGKLGMLICYDMEFPETSRILALRGAELIIIPSYFSLGSEKKWDIQLPARALDNTVFVLGVNSLGEKSFGKSKLLNPQGALVYECGRLEEEILLCDIDLNEIHNVRKKTPYLKDFDKDLVPGSVSIKKHQ